MKKTMVALALGVLIALGSFYTAGNNVVQEKEPSIFSEEFSQEKEPSIFSQELS